MWPNPAARCSLGVVRREAAWEYLRGALWVMPTAAVLIALALGKALASVEVSADAAFVFQGTADDARDPVDRASPARWRP